LHLPHHAPLGSGGVRRCHQLVSLVDDRLIDIDVRNAVCGHRRNTLSFLGNPQPVTLSVNNIERRCSSLNNRWLRH
jgi:hypothetical protein